MFRDGAVKLAREIGVSDSLLDIYYGTMGDGRPANAEVDPRIREFESTETRGTVVFPSVEGGYTHHTDCILAHAFQTRGYEPVVLVCDEVLSHCHRKTYGEDDTVTCTHCTYNSNKTAEKFGLDALRISEVVPDSYISPSLPEGSDLHGFVYRDVPVHKYALASARKHLKKYTVDFSDEYENGVYREFVRAAALLVDTAHHLYDGVDPDAVVANEPVYVYGGVFLAVAEKLGIAGRSYGYGVRERSIVFGNQNNETPMSRYTDRDFMRDFVDQPLESDERKRVERLMRERRGGETRTPLPDASSRLELLDNGTTLSVGVFTNLLWDASLQFEDSCFESPFEWLRTTIEVLGGMEGVELVVKTHPHEDLRTTNERITDWLLDNYRDGFSNLTILEPDTDVNVYSLMEDLDVGLVYNSTVGLEMAYAGKPVVVAGYPHYRGLGFTYDADTEEEYVELLEGLGDLDSNEDMGERAERYAYLLFEKTHLDFPFYETNDEDLGVSFLPVSHDDLKPGNENFDAIVEAVLSDAPVIRPD